MERDTLIGVDIGSSSTKVTVFDTEARVLGEAREPYAPRQDGQGVAEYDTDLIHDLLLKALGEAFARSGATPGSVVAIGIASMVAGIMAVDAANAPLCPYTTTLDVRFAPYMDAFVRDHGPRIRALTGSGIPALAAKIAWLQRDVPGIDALAARFVTINAHLMGRLTAARADDLVIDHTFLWCTGLADAQRYRWSEELCQALGIDLVRLPRIVMAGRHASGLSPEAAARTGLLAGTPVVLGSGDQCAGLLAAGVTGPGLLGDVAGTYPTLAACVDGFRPDHDGGMIEVFPSVLPDRWHPLFFIGGGGLTHAWATGTILGADDPASLAMLVQRATDVPPRVGRRAVRAAPGRTCVPIRLHDARCLAGLHLDARARPSLPGAPRVDGVRGAVGPGGHRAHEPGHRMAGGGPVWRCRCERPAQPDQGGRSGASRATDDGGHRATRGGAAGCTGCGLGG